MKLKKNEKTIKYVLEVFIKAICFAAILLIGNENLENPNIYLFGFFLIAGAIIQLFNKNRLINLIFNLVVIIGFGGVISNMFLLSIGDMYF